MKHFGQALLALTLGLGALASSPAWSEENLGSYSYSPVQNSGGKWRIAYYQGGNTNNYYRYLSATVKGLMDLGWVEQMQLPEDEDRDTRPLWEWLGTHLKSDFVEFVPDAYYTADWDGDKRTAMRKSLIDRLNTDDDLNLVIAMGTWAGKDLANDEHSTPIMVMSSTDPFRAGIIESNEDSGYDHVHARVDPLRHERQLRVFRNIIGFEKLGVAYEDSVLGRSYAAIELIEKFAKEENFEVVRCFTKDDIPNRALAGSSVVNCFEELVPQVDAMYVVSQNGVNADTIPRLVTIANKHRVPTFSQQGSEEVRYGFLLSIARGGGFKPVGRFLATTMAKIFNGAQPRQLKQLFEERPAIAINLKTAENIGLYLYADVLAAADEIYPDIETP